MNVGETDLSGTPRSRADVEAALLAVEERLMRGPVDPFILHLTTIREVLMEALRGRAMRGE